MKYQDIINSLNTLASNEPNNKLHIKDVDKLLSFIGSNDDTRTKVIHDLEDRNILVTPKGFSSMSPLQKTIHRFINDQLLSDLMKLGKATLEVDSESLKSLVDDDGKFYVLNAKGDLIKPSCNNTNITEARRVALAKKQMEEVQPNK